MVSMLAKDTCLGSRSRVNTFGLDSLESGVLMMLRVLFQQISNQAGDDGRVKVEMMVALSLG